MDALQNLGQEDMIQALLPRVSKLQQSGSPQVSAEDLTPRIRDKEPFPRIQALMGE